MNNGGGNVNSTLTAASTNNDTTDGTGVSTSLAYNGGPTPNVSIATSGPAYQGGDLATCEGLSSRGINGTPYTGSTAVDQRGAPRIVNGKCSIGAYEPGQVQTFTTLATSATSVNAAQPVTLTASVSGVLGNFPTTGTVAFNVGATAITGCTVQAVTNGVASCITSALPGGSDSITATYMQPGTDAVYATSPASNTVTVTVAAITCTVTSTMDPSENGKLTLRDAVNAANGGGCTGDAITFATGLTGTITLAQASGTLVLNHNVTITGPTGTNGVTIDGGCTDCAPGGAGTNSTGVGVLFVNSNITATLANLTIANGHVRPSDPGHTYGGGIENNGTLTLTNCTFLNNRADRRGGGLDNETKATVTVTGSTFTGNSTSAGFGGAITNNGGTLGVSNSTLTNNTASDNGGAIENTGGGTATVTASTITGNHAGGSGGGLRNAGGSLTLIESIVAGNTARGGPDISNNASTFTDGGNNVVGIGDGGAGLTNGTNGDKVGTAAAPLTPLLSALGSYGGPTQTVALLPGSPALDTGNCASGVTTDQRGIARPQGASCDSGAFESQGFAFTTLTGNTQSATVTTDFAAPLALTVTSSHSEPVTGGTVTFTITRPTGMNGAGIGFEPPGTTGCTVSSDQATAVCPVAMSGVSTTPAIKAGVIAGSFTVTASTAGVPVSGNVTYTLMSTSGAAFITPQAAPKATASATSVSTPLPMAATHTPGATVGASTPTPLPQPVRH